MSSKPYTPQQQKAVHDFLAAADQLKLRSDMEEGEKALGSFNSEYETALGALQYRLRQAFPDAHEDMLDQAAYHFLNRT